jgi:AcrR family transcriptional regulator
MIYYHFHSKRALYTSVLRDVFTAMGDRLSAIGASDADPADKMDRFVAAFVLEGQQVSHVAPIMLREIAEGGRRLDEETYTVMVRVVRAMAGIVDQGRATGQFAAVDPLLLYLTTIWPIVVYLATTPIRSALARVAHFDPSRLDPERFIRHMQMLNRRALMPAAAGAGPTGEMS